MPFDKGINELFLKKGDQYHLSRTSFKDKKVPS